ncbi:MAG: C4-dicarboxylate ABC transporter substrate-binding protein, partial [Pseudomonadota bacterium]
WNGLDEATQTVFRDCAATAEAEGLEASIAYTNFTLDGLREGGMTVGKASDEMVEGLKAVGETMTAEWLEAAGDEGAAIVDSFEGMQ